MNKDNNIFEYYAEYNRILIIDDEQDMVRLLQIILEDNGYNVHTANNYYQAVEKLSENAYDLVLTDIVMPGMNGIEVVKYIRQNIPHCNVIIITGKPKMENAIEAIHEGAYDYITKPFENERLLHIIKSAIREKKLYEENLNYASNLEKTIEDKTHQIEVNTRIMMHQEKMASIGMLASGIAHEISNPLSAILMITQVLKTEVKSKKLENQIDIIEEHIKRVHSILKNMMSLARPSQSQFNLDNINSIITDTIDLIQYDKRSNNIEYNLNLDEQLPDIMLITDQMKELLINILVNSLDAIEDDHTGNNYINISTLHDKINQSIVIDIEDSGKGVPENIQNKIFDTFYSTKRLGKGTGLGLALSKQIIETHNGEIIYLNDCRGAHFRITLPLKQAITTK